MTTDEKKYIEIGTCFERALEGIPLALSFERSIQIMKTKPELAARLSAWDDMMWLNVEEYLNNSPPPQDTDKNESFIRACALLEAYERRRAQYIEEDR